jgi:hypothetical protein
MSVFNDELDLEVLKHALENYSAQIPREEIDALLHLMHNWKHQQPNAAQQICQFAAQSEPIDRAYDHALVDMRRQYATQQRAKSAVLTPQTHGELNGLTPIAINSSPPSKPSSIHRPPDHGQSSVTTSIRLPLWGLGVHSWEARSCSSLVVVPASLLVRVWV